MWLSTAHVLKLTADEGTLCDALKQSGYDKKQEHRGSPSAGSKKRSGKEKTALDVVGCRHVRSKSAVFGGSTSLARTERLDVLKA